MKEKKIIFFIGTLGQGGAERVISILSKAMADRGYQVDILLYFDSAIFYEIHPKVNVIFVERETSSKNIFKNLLWMRHYLQQGEAIIVSFLASFNIVALLAHLGLKTPIIVADRNDPRYVPFNPIVRVLRNIMYLFADGVVLQTNSNKDYFGGKIRNKSVVIYNPVDLGVKAGLALRTKKDKKIVSVARLMPQKNQKMLIEAFSKVKVTFPEYSLVIYGEGEIRDDLQALISGLQMEDCVYLPGTSKQIFEDIASAELFVLSSDFEGMPNSLIEALCLGLPCISTKVSGATDLIQNGVNGELIDIGAVEELESTMLRLLGDSERRLSYATKAIELNNILDTDIIVQKWINYIDSFV